MSTGPLHLLHIKDMIQPHGNPPVNYPASENDVSHSRKLALNIYKSPITDLNEPFQRDSGGSTKREKWPCKGRERGEDGNNSVEAGRGKEKKRRETVNIWRHGRDGIKRESTGINGLRSLITGPQPSILTHDTHRRHHFQACWTVYFGVSLTVT